MEKQIGSGAMVEDLLECLECNIFNCSSGLFLSGCMVCLECDFFRLHWTTDRKCALVFENNLLAASLIEYLTSVYDASIEDCWLPLFLSELPPV